MIGNAVAVFPAVDRRTASNFTSMTTRTRPLVEPSKSILRDAPVDVVPIEFCSDIDSEISPESDSPEDRPSEPVEIEDRPREPVEI